MKIPSLLTLPIILFTSFSLQAQKITNKVLYMNIWHITNVNIDSNTIFNQDTLTLRQGLRSGDKYYYDSTNIAPYDTWKIYFGENHELAIYSLQIPAPGKIINRRKYYTQMFPSLNIIWSKKRKTIRIKIDDELLVKYKIYQYSHLELILVKIDQSLSSGLRKIN
ncbi:MAG: hypothetical protein MK105_00335 [Crocinitomicaceae bacterium]|nr:hypothetical protein [Crocinitomicaceae bacterium]